MRATRSDRLTYRGQTGARHDLRHPTANRLLSSCGVESEKRRQGRGSPGVEAATPVYGYASTLLARKGGACTSRLSLLKGWVSVSEFDVGVAGGESPVHLALFGVRGAGPGEEFLVEDIEVGDASAEALLGQAGQFDLGDVEP